MKAMCQSAEDPLLAIYRMATDGFEDCVTANIGIRLDLGPAQGLTDGLDAALAHSIDASMEAAEDGSMLAMKVAVSLHGTEAMPATVAVDAAGMQTFISAPWLGSKIFKVPLT